MASSLRSHARHVISLALLTSVFSGLAHCTAGSSAPSVAGGGAGNTNASDGSGGGAPPATLGVPKAHRVSASTCTVPRGMATAMDAGGNNPFATCNSDAECTMGKNGRCQSVYNSMACACNYDECTTDGDCAGGTCECRTADASRAPNRCLPRGDCATDADCGADGYCSPSLLLGDTCNPLNIAYYCHTQSDECVDDFQCSQGNCLYDHAKQHWRCNAYPGCDGGVSSTCW